MYSNKNSGGYTYTDAGFNGFLRRTLLSDPTVGTLPQLKRNSLTSGSLNFDSMQVSGNMGDSMEVGSVLIDGATGSGRIDGRDRELAYDTVWRVGEEGD